MAWPMRHGGLPDPEPRRDVMSLFVLPAFYLHLRGADSRPARR
jgi:hypothetical protein